MIALFASCVVSTCLFAPQATPAAGDKKPAAEAQPVASKTLPADATEITDAQIAEFLARIHGGEASTVVRELENHPLVKKAWNRRAEVVLGTALYFAGRTREANLLAIKHKNATSRDPVQLKFVGYAFLGIEDFSSAEIYFRLAAHLSKDDVEARFNEVRARALGKPSDEALAAAKEFEPHESKLPKDMFAKAIADLSLRLARLHVLTGAVGEPTFVLLRDAIARRPGDIDAYELLASLHIERGEFEAAAPILDEMERRFDDRMWTVVFLKARVQEKRGELKQALSLAQDAVTLSDWKHLPSLLLVARTAMTLDRLDDARRPLDEALLVAPGDYDAWTLFARYLYVRASTAPDGEARRDFLSQCEKAGRRAVGINSNDPAVFQILFDLYTLWGSSKQAELEAARQDLERTRLLAERAKKSAGEGGGSQSKPR